MPALNDTGAILSSAIAHQTLSVSRRNNVGDLEDPGEDEDDDLDAMHEQSRIFAQTSAMFLGMCLQFDRSVRGPYEQW
ncbi:hypothetical protein PAXRUDRAFT_831145, partial [Paxillus rubicundulus Ve08.2h10]